MKNHTKDYNRNSHIEQEQCQCGFAHPPPALSFEKQGGGEELKIDFVRCGATKQSPNLRQDILASHSQIRRLLRLKSTNSQRQGYDFASEEKQSPRVMPKLQEENNNFILEPVFFLIKDKYKIRIA
ncbi:MAG: hypothetical protein WAT71_12600 [Ignavibacteria bacterium]